MKDIKTLKTLKKLILKTKKDEPADSKAYQAILKQVEAQTIGVSNPETNEEILIFKAVSKELKEQEQSKAAGAPYNRITMMVCHKIYEEMKPETLTEAEMRVIIDRIIHELRLPNMGSVMKIVRNVENIDMKYASKYVKQAL